MSGNAMFTIVTSRKLMNTRDRRDRQDLFHLRCMKQRTIHRSVA